MKRRSFVTLTAAAVGPLAGCSNESASPSATPTATRTRTPTPSPNPSPTASPTASPTETPRTNPDTIFVDREYGSDFDAGTSDEPVETIQQAFDMVQPGETIQVRPGRYRNHAETQRAGTPAEPITITGPPDAVFNADGPMELNHSHVHLRGLTFDGLHAPSRPEDADSYSESLLQVNEKFAERIYNGTRPPGPVDEADYLTDVVVKPHAVGNCRADFIKVGWSKALEIGEFVVMGPAGVKFLKGDDVGHNSEIVYLGNAPSKEFPPDRTRDIHIHHIDNSAGYPHAELVDCKTGTSNVTIEYCTDAGGASEAITDEGTESAIHLGGTDITVRWNVITGGEEAGIEIDSDIAATDEPPAAYADGGTNNAIYGNRLLDNSGRALQFAYPETQGQDDQRLICGNAYNEETHGDPDQACPNDVPKGDGISHLGGDSPWTESSS